MAQGKDSILIFPCHRASFPQRFWAGIQVFLVDQAWEKRLGRTFSSAPIDFSPSGPYFLTKETKR